MIYTLLDKGILYDENGKLTESVKGKILEILGFGNWESAKNLQALHTRRADNENLALLDGEKVDVKVIDDNKLHIDEHIAFMLSGEYEKNATSEIENNFLEHIMAHKKLLKEGE